MMFFTAKKENSMTPFVIAALVAASLFTTGTVIKPHEPTLGRVLQGAGVGTLVGGAIGTAGGAATAFGVETAGAAVTTGAVVGGGAGGTAGALFKW